MSPSSLTDGLKYLHLRTLLTYSLQGCIAYSRRLALTAGLDEEKVWTRRTNRRGTKGRPVLS